MPYPWISVFIRGENSFPVFKRGIELTRRAERARFERLVDAPRQPGEHLARPALAQARDARRRKRLDAAGPLPRQVQLPPPRTPDTLPAGLHSGIPSLEGTS